MATMPSLLLVIFLLQLTIHLLNTVWSTKFGELLWAAYNKFPTSTSSSYKQASHLRREAVRLKRDLDSTSAQDQFAKWAKLQRQYDKTKSEYDQQANELRSFETSFKRVASVVRWLSTNGIRFFLQWWFGKQPMFWLPRGWVPGSVEWVLALPKAPSGSIGINIWWMACANVILIAAEGIAAAYSLSSATEAKTMETPMEAAGSTPQSGTEKKEL